MSEEMIPDVPETLDVVQNEEPAVNYADMNLAELVKEYETLASGEDRMKRYKELEIVKSAFYKRLEKEKSAAGMTVAETVTDEVPAGEDVAEEARVSANPFEEIEQGFRSIYNKYKKERAEFNKQQEEERTANSEAKRQVIEELKELLGKQEDVNATMPAFRHIQDKWRAIGHVLQKDAMELNNTYQLYVEQFYDMLHINMELRDLDFKKNLEAKEKLCAEAESLIESADIVGAFKELQKLHENWKELGPVAKQYREDIWNRFKAATAVINRKYQAYFEEQKAHFAENLAAKEKLCEAVEELAGREISLSSEWNECAKQVEDIQKQWKTIGYASRKDNQKVYERFRAACDRFYERKRLFYAEYKEGMNANLRRKIEICEAAEALKNSTEWKKTTDQLINLQKQWKEIGIVPRKKSEQLWKRFRAACDEFFNEKEKHAKPENDFYGNLKQKKQLIERIKTYTRTGNEEEDYAAMQAFISEWQSIGFVPFKEKDKIADAYKEAMDTVFPEHNSRKSKYGKSRAGDKDRLIQKYIKKEQEIVTYENNIGFFSESKSSEPLIRQMRDRIEQAKKELKDLEMQIRELETAENK